MTYYEVITENDQRAVVASLQELYRLQKKRIEERIRIENDILKKLASNVSEMSMALQALDLHKEFDRAQSILADILSIYMGIEASRRAAPTPEGHPTNNSGSTSTGSQTQVKLSVEGSRMRNTHSNA